MKINDKMALMPVQNLIKPAVELNQVSVDGFDRKKQQDDKVQNSKEVGKENK